MGRRSTILALSGLAVLLWASAVFLTATYHVPDAGITYTTKLTWSHLAAVAHSVGWRELKNALTVYDVSFWVSVMLVVAAAVLAEGPYGPRMVLALASPAILLVPLNVMAMLAAAADVLSFTPYDGEFLAEGWPQNYVYAAWTLGTALLAWNAARARVPRPQNTRMQPTASVRARRGS